MRPATSNGACSRQQNGRNDETTFDFAIDQPSAGQQWQSQEQPRHANAMNCAQR
jgi:hypothetical protein